MKLSLLLLCFYSVCCFSNAAATGIFGKKSQDDLLEKAPAIYASDSIGPTENAVIPGDFADPSVIRHGDVYYAAGTSSEWAPHYPIYTSADLLHWRLLCYVFLKTPSWAASSFWAPELYYRNGTFYVYYVARAKSDSISCIGVATSKDPAKGFTDQGIVLKFGKEAIDPFLIEDSGSLYITWKAFGLDKRPTEILGSRLSEDGLKVEGEPFMLLRDDNKKGLEGQCLVKRNNYYYLFYSAGDCCGSGCSYQVEVARSASLRGPYSRYNNNPLLSKTADWKCTGHGTIASSKDGDDFYLYHAYHNNDVYTGRQGMLGKVNWNAQTGWPEIQPMGAQATPVKDFRNDFSTDTLSLAWQWDFRHSVPAAKIHNGHLYLSGETVPGNLSGTALTVRPVTGNYEISTEVVNHNASLKGLVLYGDAGQSIGVGITGSTIQVWNVRNKERKILAEEKIKLKRLLKLKLLVTGNNQCRAYWSSDGLTWKQLKSRDDYYNADFLPPWDRSPRPGMLHRGAVTEPAIFSYFNLKNL